MRSAAWRPFVPKADVISRRCENECALVVVSLSLIDPSCFGRRARVMNVNISVRVPGFLSFVCSHIHVCAEALFIFDTAIAGSAMEQFLVGAAPAAPIWARDQDDAALVLQFVWHRGVGRRVSETRN